MADRSERFFGWVWRINGLLLLAVGLVGVFGTIAIFLDWAFSWSRDRPQQQVTAVAGADLDAEDLRLADFQRIQGTRFLYARLAEPAEYLASGSGRGRGLTRNLLFFDVTTKKAHWLLPDNEQIIQSFYFLMDPPAGRRGYIDGGDDDRDRVAIAMLVELQREQATGSADGRSRSLAIASPVGRDLTRIADSIGGLLGFHQPGPNSTLVFYVSDGSARVLEVDPTTRKVRSDLLVSAEE